MTQFKINLVSASYWKHSYLLVLHLGADKLESSEDLTELVSLPRLARYLIFLSGLLIR